MSSALVDLWPFQKTFVQDEGRFVAACWARGNGKSAMTGLKIALNALENEVKGTPSDWLIVSASLPQAKEALEQVVAWVKAFYRIASKLEIIEEEVEYRTPEGLQRYTRYCLRLDRTKIMAIATSPSALRGYTANIWWDEAAFFDRDHEMWQALQHCTRGRLKIIVTSTPLGGEEKKFHQIVHSQITVRGRLLWSNHTCDIYRAIADGRPYDLEAERAASAADAWAQEMELQWIDNKATWFPIELLRACESEQASLTGEGYLGGKCYLGNDIGLRGDRWVAWVLEELADGRLCTREVVVLAKSTFEEHDRQIARLFAKYDIQRMAIDQGGMGERSTEGYQRLYGASRVEGVLFNPNNKGAMATLGKDLMEQGKIFLVDDLETRKDLRRLQKTTSAAGAVRFDAVRDQFGHADRCWAFLLACNAAVTPVTQIESKSSGQPQMETALSGYGGGRASANDLAGY